MSKPNKNTGGVYANMEFPIYSFVEYPKHIPTGQWGQYEVANNEEDEIRILGKLQKEDDTAAAYVAPVPLDPEKETLINRAKELGVPYNSKWSKAKLTQVVTEAEKAIDELPPETHTIKQPPVSNAFVAAEAEKFEEPAPKTEQEIKNELRAQAKELGIANYQIMGTERLQMEIAAAKTKLNK